jgi:hypothetical protein
MTLEPVSVALDSRLHLFLRGRPVVARFTSSASTCTARCAKLTDIPGPSTGISTGHKIDHPGAPVDAEDAEVRRLNASQKT